MTSAPAWLDQQHPFGVSSSRAQIRGVLKLLGRRSRRVLDLGCGSGRVLAPLARAGHQVTGIDRDADALIRCRENLRTSRTTAELIHGDFLRRIPRGLRVDAVLCLGNTFMMLADIDRAVNLLVRISRQLSPRGLFIIDDLPRAFIPELTSGRWQNGMSPDGRWQMVWHPTDAVFTIRTGRQINRRQWSLRPTDVRFRLWCDGSLELTANRAGLSAPKRIGSSNLLVCTRMAGLNEFSGTSRRRRTKTR